MQQTATDFWQELQDGTTMPQAANLKRLCELLDWVIAHLPEAQQLEAAGRAIEQMAKIYALRFNLLIGSWEEADSFLGEALPVLDLETLEIWMRQSMSVDLDALIEQPKSKRNHNRQTHYSTDSVLAVVEPEALLRMVEQIEVEESQMIQQLAGEEDPTRWSAAIAQWFQSHAPSPQVRLSDLLCQIDMPWVEIWMGLLLGEFELEQQGAFYSASHIWVSLR